MPKAKKEIDQMWDNDTLKTFGSWYGEIIKKEKLDNSLLGQLYAREGKIYFRGKDCQEENYIETIDDLKKIATKMRLKDEVRDEET